ncbi:integrase catalytic domain-containing protein [Trichonephila clavipes]|nr:integrase catalytic domain-containing protein [Trichonephila clavipes]
MTEFSSNFYDELFNVTNNFIKLIRIFSFIFRFINNIKAKESCNKEKYLTADEVKRSTEFLAKIAQLSEFKAEIDALKKGKGVSKTSKLKALDPFLDENSLLRVGGRLCNADLPFEAKHQIIIPIPLSDNINEYEVLTPGHFIIGRPISAIPEPAILDISDNRLSRWQYTTKCVQTIWKRWKNDYLNHLQQRNKWQFEKNNVAVGCLVLLKENDLPPCKWTMARILEVIYGTDGPNLIEQIPDILDRFRRYPIGLSADIEKAFLQLGITPKHRDFLRFFYPDEAKVEDKQFKTLNKETATHIGMREAEDWFRPIDLAKECDIYISSRSGSHKEIPITYGYTQDPFKNRPRNFKPKIKENYPQNLEREK